MVDIWVVRVSHRDRQRKQCTGKATILWLLTSKQSICILMMCQAETKGVSFRE